MRTLLAALLVCAGIALAQPGGNNITNTWSFTTTNPNGNTCNQGQAWVLMPAGTLYTCQNGTVAQASGGGAGMCPAGSSGAVQKTNGTNCVASSIVDNATTVTISEPTNFTATATGAPIIIPQGGSQTVTATSRSLSSQAAVTGYVDAGAAAAFTGVVKKTNTANVMTEAAATSSDLAAALTVGNAVTGGGANRILFEDTSQNLAASNLFIFNASSLITVPAIWLNHTTPTLSNYTMYEDGSGNLNINDTGTVFLGTNNGQQVHVDSTGLLVANVTGVAAKTYQSVGTVPTITGCGTITAQTGGATFGTFTTSTTGTCAANFALPTVTNGWVCWATDLTKHVVANILMQSASSVSSCTVTGTTAASDVIQFSAFGY